jgi:SAM-dependent methyltransferase
MNLEVHAVNPDPSAPPPARSRAYEQEKSLYLDRVRELFGDYKRHSVAFCDLAPGHHVLDVGCGTGDDALAIAGIVGPGGQVTGVDNDPAMIAEARRRAGDKLPHLSFSEADAAALPLEPESVDRARSDRVFQYVHDPQAALHDMVRVTRPGGLVTVFDADWETLVVDSGDRDLTRKILHHTCDQQGNGWSGRTLYRLFKDCELTDVEVTTESICVYDKQMAAFIWGLDVFAARARDDGVISPADARRWLQDLDTRDRDGRFFAAFFGFGVRGRKP